jgi:hypothetical protein
MLDRIILFEETTAAAVSSHEVSSASMQEDGIEWVYSKAIGYERRGNEAL